MTPEERKARTKVYSKRYRENNKDAVAAKDKERYERNREKVLARKKLLYIENQEARKQYQREYRKRKKAFID